MQVDAVLSYFEELKAQHHQVSNKSRALTDSCESLVGLLYFCNAVLVLTCHAAYGQCNECAQGMHIAVTCLDSRSVCLGQSNEQQPCTDCVYCCICFEIQKVLTVLHVCWFRFWKKKDFYNLLMHFAASCSTLMNWNRFQLSSIPHPLQLTATAFCHCLSGWILALRKSWPVQVTFTI